MSYSPPDGLVTVKVPEDCAGAFAHAHNLLRSHGYNIKAVSHVFPASNKIMPGYEVIYFTALTGNQRCAYVWHEKGKLKIKCFDGWFNADYPPEKKS